MDFIFLFSNFFVFVFGLCAGSFLNCLIYRLTLPNFSFWKNLGGLSRSYCPKCKKQLKWRDLIPVFSFLFLKGKCRYCRQKISWQYPAVEILTASIFLLIINFIILEIKAMAFISSIQTIFRFFNAAFLFYIASVLIIIFVYDLKHYLIPDKILFPAIIITLFYRIFEFLNFKLNSNFKFQISNSGELFNYIIAAVVASGFFLIIFLISKGRWMGFGDVKLAVLMGLLLGLPNTLAALFLAFFFGAIIGLMLMIFKKKNLKSQVPFAPFLIIGTFIAMFWGSQIIGWYLEICNFG